jgi:hypothetical protein
MSVIRANLSVSPQELFTSSSTQGTDLGALATSGDGRYFRYSLAGGVTYVPGKVYQGPAEDTTNQNPSGGLAVAAAAIGATQVTLTGTLTLAANLLAGSYMSVAVTPGQGYLYKVKSNTAVAGAANCVVTLEDPIIVALTTASKVVFQQNPYNGCVVTPSTMTASVAGIPVYAVTNAQYGWIQTHGMASCLQTGTGTCGTALGVLQGGTSGSLAPAIAGTPIVAWAANTNITGQYGNVFLVID